MKDIENRMLINRIEALEKKLARIESVRQIPQTASLTNVIDIINKITDNMKRNRWLYIA